MEEIEARARRCSRASRSGSGTASHFRCQSRRSSTAIFGLRAPGCRGHDGGARSPSSPRTRIEQLSGLLLPSRSSEIWVNASEARKWPLPCRLPRSDTSWAIWVLHRNGQQSAFSAAMDQWRNRIPLPRRRPRSPKVTEEEANVFAAALLMPARPTRCHYLETGKDHTAMRQLLRLQPRRRRSAHASGALQRRTAEPRHRRSRSLSERSSPPTPCPMSTISASKAPAITIQELLAEPLRLGDPIVSGPLAVFPIFLARPEPRLHIPGRRHRARAHRQRTRRRRLGQRPSGPQPDPTPGDARRRRRGAA